MTLRFYSTIDDVLIPPTLAITPRALPASPRRGRPD